MHFELRLEPGTDIDIEVDPTKLRQIVLNLLNNIVKFSPDKGSVLLRTRLIPDTGGPLSA
jgi:signal transduction histidine kinase